jgi:hypothetical protein
MSVYFEADLGYKVVWDGIRGDGDGLLKELLASTSSLLTGNQRTAVKQSTRTYSGRRAAVDLVFSQS